MWQGPRAHRIVEFIDQRVISFDARERAGVRSGFVRIFALRRKKKVKENHDSIAFYAVMYRARGSLGGFFFHLRLERDGI